MKKQFKITLSEELHAQMDSLIGEIPVKWGVPLLNIINQNIEEEFVNKEKHEDKDRSILES